MFRRFVLAVVAVGGLAIEAQAVGKAPSIEARSVAWRGGFRARSYAYRGSGSYNSYSSRGNVGRSSPLDYPASTQPAASRRHQWNKYPNQPYYLRGERKSLGILP